MQLIYFSIYIRGIKIEKLDWKELTEILSGEVKKIKDKKFIPDVIIGIERSGAILGQIMVEAEFFNCDFKTDPREGRLRKQRQKLNLDPKQTKYLIVDDGTDTGQTLIECFMDILRELKTDIDTKELKKIVNNLITKEHIDTYDPRYKVCINITNRIDKATKVDIEDVLYLLQLDAINRLDLPKIFPKYDIKTFVLFHDKNSKVGVDYFHEDYEKHRYLPWDDIDISEDVDSTLAELDEEKFNWKEKVKDLIKKYSNSRYTKSIFPEFKLKPPIEDKLEQVKDGEEIKYVGYEITR